MSNLGLKSRFVVYFVIIHLLCKNCAILCYTLKNISGMEIHLKQSANAKPILTFFKNLDNKDANLNALYIIDRANVPDACFKSGSCHGNTCPLAQDDLVFRDDNKVCVPGIYCEGILVGAKCDVYIYNKNTTTGVIHPIVLKFKNNTHTDLHLLTPACRTTAVTNWMFDLSGSGGRHLNNHIKTIVNNCGKPPLVATVQHEFALEYVNPSVPYNIHDFVTNANTFERIYDNRVFSQDCLRFKAACYYLVKQLPFYKLYSCTPVCGVLRLNNTGGSWYERLANLLFSVLRVETVLNCIYSIVTDLVRSMVFVVRELISVVFMALPSVKIAISGVVSELMDMGVIDTALIAMFAYSYGTIPLSITVTIVLCYMRALIL